MRTYNLPIILVAIVLAVLVGVVAFDAGTAQADAPLGTAKMKRANRAAAKVVRARMESERPADFKLLETVKSAEIIVVTGTYDRVQDVLDAVGVPHLAIGPTELDRIELNAKQLLMINCPGGLSRSGIEKVRKFVNAGGFLYTTDWALLNVVQKAFPGYIKYNKRPTTNDIVEVEVRKTDNVFLQHVQLAKDNPKWWLEGQSYPIQVLRANDVEVLVDSSEMKKKYGAGAIAVTFPYGDGRVLHIVSHFYLQQGQSRTIAEKKGGGKYLFEDSVISGELAGQLAADEDVSEAEGGDLQSAYAAQQMTTNLVVTRKKDQARIDRLYNRRLKKRASKSGERSLDKGAKVKVVGKKGDKLKIRAMNGDELWLDEALVE